MFQNITDQTNQMLMADDAHYSNGLSNKLAAVNEPVKNHLTALQTMVPAVQNYIIKDPETDEPPLFSSTKQI